MTQEDLEAILSQYIKIMDSFKSIINPTATNKRDSEVEAPPTDNTVQPNQQVNRQHQSTLDRLTNNSMTSLILCPAIHSSLYATVPPPRPDFVDHHRRHLRQGNQRISWTRDTGLSSFAASQHFAGELQSLFDMEFKVDIALDINSTLATQLPELSCRTEKQQRRSSVDSFSRLIPAFESFQIDGHDGLSYVSMANKRTSSVSHKDLMSQKRASSTLAPARSSSLKYRDMHQRQQSSAVVSAPVPPLPRTEIKSTLASENCINHASLYRFDAQYRKPSLAKKKSIRKLAALFGKKLVDSDPSVPHESTLPIGPVTTYNAITTSFTTTHTISGPSSPTHRIIIPSISPTEALKIYSTGGILLSPLSSIAASPSSTLARRRRSNSFPEMYTSINTYPFDSVGKPQRTVSFEQTSPDPRSQQMTRLPPIHLSNSNRSGISTTNLDEQHSSKLDSTYVTKADNLGKSQPALYHSKSGSRKPRQYQPYHHEMHQSHSAQELSRFGSIGNGESINSASSSLVRSPTTSKKQQSSLLKRMTSFARRKKPIDNVVQNGIPSPVSV